MTDPELDPANSLMLLLGHVAHEGVVSALSAAGRQYKQKYPESQIMNWHSILRYFDRFSVIGVIWKIGPGAYQILAHPNYQKARDALISRIARVPNIIFIHEDLLTGRDDGLWSFDFYQPKPEVRKVVHECSNNTILKYCHIEEMLRSL